MTQQFKVGDRVRKVRNPKTIGIVTGVNKRLFETINVRWAGCLINCYLPPELILCSVLASKEFNDENKRKEIL